MSTTTSTTHPTHTDGRSYDRFFFANILEHAGHVAPDELRRWAIQSERIECYWNATAYRAAADYIEAGDLHR